MPVSGDVEVLRAKHKCSELYEEQNVSGEVSKRQEHSESDQTKEPSTKKNKKEKQLPSGGSETQRDTCSKEDKHPSQELNLPNPKFVLRTETKTYTVY